MKVYIYAAHYSQEQIIGIDRCSSDLRARAEPVEFANFDEGEVWAPTIFGVENFFERPWFLIGEAPDVRTHAASPLREGRATMSTMASASTPRLIAAAILAPTASFAARSGSADKWA